MGANGIRAQAGRIRSAEDDRVSKALAAALAENDVIKVKADAAKLAGEQAITKASRLKEELESLCEKEIALTHESTNTNQGEYDKQLLTLSAAILGLSLAFIKDIVPFASAVHKWFLYFAFIALALCIFFVLASFQVSNFALWRAKKYWEEKQAGNISDFPYWVGTLVRTWNLCSGLLFCTGISLCVSFVIVNLTLESPLPNNPPNGDQVQKGQNVKVPPPPPPSKPPSPLPPTNK